MDRSVDLAGRVGEFWDDVLADMEATAEQYREDGWDVVELHPGAVTALDGEAGDDGDGRWGLDVLVPDNEFPEVERRVLEEDGEFDASEVFRATGGGLVFAVVAMLDADGREAILFPTYYDPADAGDVIRRARREGKLPIHVRTLRSDPVVTFRQDDPSLFLPE